MHAFTECAGAFSVNHAHSMDAALPAFIEVIRKQIGDFVRAEGVKIEFSSDGNLHWRAVIEWLFFRNHPRMNRRMMIRLAAAAIAIFSSILAAAEPLRITINGEPGPYTVERWKHDWPGCEWEDGIKEGHVSTTKHDGKNWLRVDYAIGQIGPEKGGCGWRYPIGRRGTAELRYTVRFSKDFDWVKGGKLPGLVGGPENVSGGRPATGTNGFSARLMWRADGRGEAYVYHKNQRSNYGDSFSFPADFRFPTETNVHVRIRVTMNEPGKKNGKLHVWIRTGDDESSAESQVVERTDMEWRTVDSFGIDALYFESFHGGSDDTWAPTRACHAEFGGMSVWP